MGSMCTHRLRVDSTPFILGMNMEGLVALQNEVFLLRHEVQPVSKSSMGSTGPQVSTACAVCGVESLNNVTCQYCWKTFCESHWFQHMSWEKGHEGFAEDYARIWKKTKTA